MNAADKNKKLLYILHEISNDDLNDLRARGDRDEIYIVCANDLNYYFFKEVSPSEEKSFKLVRYYGNAKQLHENYIALIVCSLLSLDTFGTFKSRHVFYNEKFFPSSIFQKMRTEFKMSTSLYFTQLPT